MGKIQLNDLLPQNRDIEIVDADSRAFYDSFNEEAQFLATVPTNNEKLRIIPETLLEQAIVNAEKSQPKDLHLARREKELVSRYERKMNRIKRIKSKSYRRLVRRDKLARVLKTEVEAFEVSSTVDEIGIDMGKNEFKSSIAKKLAARSAERNGGDSTTDQNVMKFGGSGCIAASTIGSNILEKCEFFESFTQIKNAVVKSEAPTPDEELILPGWGEWAGVGIDVIKTKHNIVRSNIVKCHYSKRVDDSIPHLIINENYISPFNANVGLGPGGKSSNNKKHKLVPEATNRGATMDLLMSIKNKKHKKRSR